MLKKIKNNLGLFIVSLIWICCGIGLFIMNWLGANVCEIIILTLSTFCLLLFGMAGMFEVFKK